MLDQWKVLPVTIPTYMWRLTALLFSFVNQLFALLTLLFYKIQKQYPEACDCRVTKWGTSSRGLNTFPGHCTWFVRKTGFFFCCCFGLFFWTLFQWLRRLPESLTVHWDFGLLLFSWPRTVEPRIFNLFKSCTSVSHCHSSGMERLPERGPPQTQTHGGWCRFGLDVGPKRPSSL